jgi:formate transporter
MSDAAATRARSADRPDPSPDVFPPKKIAQATTRKGAQKVGLDLPVLTVLGVLAGAYIAFGGLFATVALAGAEGRAGFSPVVWALGLAYVTNLVGSLAIAALAFWAGAHTAGEGAVGAAALSTARTKTALDFGTAVASGIAANTLVCLAVWLAFGARSAADKVLVIVPPIAAFVAAGFEHSVANMYLIPFGWLVKEFAAPEFWGQAGLDPAGYAALTPGGFAWNLIPVTIGNVIGGLLVGTAYWLAYLRPQHRGA